MLDETAPKTAARDPRLLKESGLALGAPGEAQLDLNTPAIQLAQGEPFCLYLRLNEAQAQSRVHFRLLRSRGETPSPWQEALASHQNRQSFKLSLDSSLAGRFLLDIRYSLDGQSWRLWRGQPLAVHIYPQQIRGLRLYTLLPNTLGPLSSWTEHLAAVKALGFTMIHLLPLTAQGSSQSPYAASSLFSFDQSLGRSTDQLLPEWLAFLESLKAQDLKLCIDLVVNHVAIDSEIVQKRPEWIQLDQKESDGFRRAGFIGPEGWQSWRDLVLINYQHPDPQIRREIWDYMSEYASFWAAFAAESSGMIRLDNLHSTPLSFAKALTHTLRQRYPQLALLGEYFGSIQDCLSIAQSCELDLLLATPWEHHFAHDLRQYLNYLHQSQSLLSWFCPINTHDSGPPAQEFASVEATLPRYLLSAGLGSGAFGMSQGVERGLLEKINFIGPPPPELYAEDRNFSSTISRINVLLERSKAFQQGSSLRFVDQNHDAIIAALRFHPDDAAEELFLLIANLDIYGTQTLRLSRQELGIDKRTVWDYLEEKAFECPSGDFSLTLPPCAIRIFQFQKN